LKLYVEGMKKWKQYKKEEEGKTKQIT
jgi:hypothetical protein